MSKIAIKGHASRGKEVIQILEMLGGRKSGYGGYGDNFYYYINQYGNIEGSTKPYEFEKYIVFTLEEFLEKFPYKIGDEVINDEGDIVKIFNMHWSERVDEIYYSVKLHDDIFKYPADLLQPYKEETMEKPKELLIGFTKDSDGNWVLNTHKDYEIKEVNGKFKLIPKQPQYPKTYEECCKIFQYNKNLKVYPPFNADIPNYDTSHLFDLLETLRKLLICRDAYWKIAGEEMGLGKPWKPDWSTESEIKYVIEVYRNNVRKNSQGYSNTILAFPTPEMRDVFYENFKDLIEACKELL